MIRLICDSLPSSFMFIPVVLATLTRYKRRKPVSKQNVAVNQKIEFASKTLDTVYRLRLISQYIVLNKHQIILTKNYVCN